MFQSAALRRLLSILLLVALGLPFASPLFALGSGAASRLPACCRREGKHHCMVSMADGEKTASRDTQVSAPPEKCPFAPHAALAVHPTALATLELSASLFSPALADPKGLVRTESKRRISRDRSRQKRGPPVLTNLWEITAQATSCSCGMLLLNDLRPCCT